MKHLIWIFLLNVLIHNHVEAEKKTFLRFYDFFGNKFESGVFIWENDSSIVIYKDSTNIVVPISKIFSIKTRGYFLKTKRSNGHNAIVHNAIISSVLVGVPLAIYGVATGEPRINDNTLGGIIHDYYTATPAEGAFLGVLGGVLVGSIAGVLLSVKHKTFVINGNIDNWHKLENRILK